jgi:hypothetical protein
MKKFIIFRGGLGNQIFQYAASSTAFDDYIQNGKLCYINSPSALAGRELGIKNFQINNLKIVSNLLINYILTPLFLRFSVLFTWKFPFINFSIVVMEKNISFDKNIFKKNALFYIGYFQSEKYFISHRKRILDDLNLLRTGSNAFKIYKDLIQSKQTSVALHVRRGDYISNPNSNIIHGFCGSEYYYNSIKYLKKYHKNLNFFIFSDDIEWCKLSFKGNYFSFIDSIELQDSDEMYLMSICNHNIISNSSFSWWGAWLNNNKDKTIIAPKKWFVDDHTESYAGDIVPKEWVRI